MGRLTRLAAVLMGLLFAAVAPALADMTGTYQGTGDVAGTTLELKQDGTRISGQFFGTYSGTLTGQTDGQNHVQGFLDENNIRYTFYADWTEQGFSITLYDTMGNTETVLFASGPGGAQPNAPVQAPPPPTANFYTFDNGTQSGPFTRQQMLDRIAAGEVGRNTMVWQPGQPEWRPARDVAELAANLPPEPPAPVRYFVVEDGAQAGPYTLEQMIARIAEGRTVGKDLVWKDGLEAWTAAESLGEFEEALRPAPAPPPAPPVAPASPAAPPPPPPPPPPDVGAAPQAPGEAPADASANEAMEPTADAPAAGPVEPAMPVEPPAAPAPPDATDSSSVVSLPDGRNLQIVGGSSQSVSAVAGGYELVIDGTAIGFVDGTLTVDGEERSVPDFATTLTLRYDRGDVTVSGD